MSLVRYSGTNIAKALQSQDLIVVESVKVAVRDLDGNIVSLYKNSAGTTPKTNPFTTDNTGQFFFYVEQGEYIVDTEKGGQTGSIQIDLTQVGSLAMTLDDAINSTDIAEGDTIRITDRADGLFDVLFVDAGGPNELVPNGFNIVQSIEQPLLALKLRVTESVFIDEWGAIPDLDMPAIGQTTDPVLIAQIISEATDNKLVLNYALNYAIANHYEFVGGSGAYYTSDQINPTVLPDTESFQDRAGNIKIRGQGITNTVFYTDAGRYIFNIKQGVTVSTDMIEVSDCMLAAPNGGGITTGDGFWRIYKRVFFNSAAENFYGHYDDGDSGAGFGVFMLHQEDCVFWNRNGYFGGAFWINNFHTFNSTNAFISQNRLDGDVIKLESGKSVSIPSIVLESVPTDGVLTLNQAFINFNGSVANVDIGTVYVEGVWRRIFRNGSSGDININIEMVNAWQRHIGGVSHADCQLYRSTGSDDVTIGKFFYTADSSVGASNELFISETNTIGQKISVETFENQAQGAGQLARKLKLNRYATTTVKGGFNGVVHVGFVFNPTITFNLGGMGSYLVNIVINSIDRNHGAVQTFMITYDSGQTTNDFAAVQPMTSVITKSTQLLGMDVTVNSATGDVTVVGEGTVDKDYNVYYSIREMSFLNTENGAS